MAKRKKRKKPFFKNENETQKKQKHQKTKKIA